MRTVRVVGSTCVLVIILFLASDHVPTVLGYLLFPGSFFAILINGSLHDRIMTGYMAVAVAFDCVLYSAVALGVSKLFRKLWKSH